jgi:uncharacterized protein YraI
LTLAATGVAVVVVTLLLVVPGAVPGFLRVATQPVQVSVLTAEPTATAARAYPTLPPAWTATPSPRPLASNTAGPTATHTASPSVTATSPASTAGASATPAASATSAHVVRILILANVRSGPGTAYPVVAGLSAGQTAPVIGRDSSAQWFAISFAGAPQGIGWVSIFVASYDGSVNDLPVIQAAPPPPPTAAPPTNTPVPAGPPTATNIPNVGGANGILTLLFQMPVTGTVNASIFFTFTVVNTTSSDITYGILAAHTDQGVTADSWHDPLLPGKVLTWNDHINFPNIGTYQVYLGICYSSHDACKTGGAPWTRLSASITVTII